MKKVNSVISLLCLLAVLFTGCGGITENSSGNTSDDNISFSNVLVTSTSGITSVFGEVKNSGAKARSFTLKVSFYDKDNNLLGTASGAVNEINGGDTQIFSAIGSSDYSSADNYKVQVDTMIKTEDNKANVIKFSNIVAKKSDYASTIEGEAKNTDSTEHSFTLLVGAYDSDGKLTGVATGAVNNLPANETKTFSAIASGDLSSAVTYKAFLSTMVQ